MKRFRAKSYKIKIVRNTILNTFYFMTFSRTHPLAKNYNWKRPIYSLSYHVHRNLVVFFTGCPIKSVHQNWSFFRKSARQQMTWERIYLIAFFIPDMKQVPISQEERRFRSYWAPRSGESHCAEVNIFNIIHSTNKVFLSPDSYWPKASAETFLFDIRLFLTKILSSA